MHFSGCFPPCCAWSSLLIANQLGTDQTTYQRVGPSAASAAAQQGRPIRGSPLSQATMAGVEESLAAAEACLKSGQPKEALQHCKVALKADKNSVPTFL